MVLYGLLVFISVIDLYGRYYIFILQIKKPKLSDTS